MPAPTDCMAGDGSLVGAAMAALVGAAMAATGLAATCDVSVAGMPAPTDCMAGHGSTCGSCHGSDGTSGDLRCRSRRHAGSHRLHGWRWQHLRELPWQRRDQRRPAMSRSPACRLPQIAWLAMAALVGAAMAALVGAAMAATGLVATCDVAVAGMPAPTDCVAGHGSTCGSCHGSDRSGGDLRCCSRRHAGSHGAGHYLVGRVAIGLALSAWSSPGRAAPAAAVA